MSLRLKLLIAASLMLVFPLVGYRYVRGMEEFLRQDQSRAVLATARALATVLQSRVALFHPPTKRSANSTELYILPLPFAIEIDGYDQDWESLALPPILTTDQLVIGRHQEEIYLLLGIHDAQLSLGGIQGNRPPQGDYLKLILTDGDAFERSWLLATEAPGHVNLNEITPPRGQMTAAYPDVRLQAALEPHPGGYSVELRLPAALLSANFSIEIHDNRNGTRTLPATGNYEVTMPSQAIGQLLEQFDPNPGQRVWVTDPQRRVLARAGKANPQAGEQLPTLLKLLLPVVETNPLDLASPAHKLNGPEIDSALNNIPSSRWRLQPELGQYRLSAAYPVRAGKKIVGAVIVEQSNQDILILRFKALAELLLGSLLSFTLALSGLLLVAGSMVKRLRRLRHTTAAAIDHHGRIRTPFTAPTGNDEISDLGKSFAALFERLGQYNQYLEQLARRLSHEIRTPLTIIRSSLENLAMSRTQVDSGEIYQQRALQGVERLENILKRLSEASRLEQALASTEMQWLDAVPLINAAIGAHQQAWPDHPIIGKLPDTNLRIYAAPELLLQGLDKLLANARDFSTPGQPITVGLEALHGQASLFVENQGPRLMGTNFDGLFDSMVSNRDGASKSQTEPHLGLGLYVVRLVAECHGGSPYAENLTRGDGVRIGFSIKIPTEPNPGT